MKTTIHRILIFYFISSIMDNKSQSTSSLIEEEFDKEDIDYMTNIFYSHKRKIEEHSYILPKELKTFYDCPTLEEYHECNEWNNKCSHPKRNHKYFVSLSIILFLTKE